ncbi:hypothetical protein CL89_gp049 [Aeromonas phage PX29]|uniref:Uncharacterized protein n=1 Tax=Aeromonas phage PX29 TaxID=926067 RepID=E5DPY2_9CAUD|nr:hypothetical protein CL89_gp049 [Aeromonas phage PX29]ADQ52768.1 conserved hypothetical protein [Aeromonas phage PX29]
MICKIVNPKRLTVGDSIRLHRDELLTIDKIEDKKVYLTNSETGEKVEVVFYQLTSKSYRYRMYHPDATYDIRGHEITGSGVNSRYGMSLGMLYDYGIKQPIAAGEIIDFCVESIYYKGVVMAVGSFGMSKNEIIFHNCKSERNAIVVKTEDGKERVIVATGQTLYFVEPDSEGRMFINNTHICVVNQYRG